MAKQCSRKVSQFYWKRKRKRYHYYLERKKKPPDYRKNCYLAHKKLSCVLKILGMNPVSKIFKKWTFDFFFFWHLSGLSISHYWVSRINKINRINRINRIKPTQQKLYYMCIFLGIIPVVCILRYQRDNYLFF